MCETEELTCIMCASIKMSASRGGDEQKGGSHAAAPSVQRVLIFVPLASFCLPLHGNMFRNG